MVMGYALATWCGSPSWRCRFLAPIACCLTSPQWSAVIGNARRNWQYPAFSAPSALLEASTQLMLPILLAMLFGPTMAGLFALGPTADGAADTPVRASGTAGVTSARRPSGSRLPLFGLFKKSSLLFSGLGVDRDGARCCLPDRRCSHSCSVSHGAPPERSCNCWCRSISCVLWSLPYRRPSISSGVKNYIWSPRPWTGVDADDICGNMAARSATNGRRSAVQSRFDRSLFALFPAGVAGCAAPSACPSTRNSPRSATRSRASEVRPGRTDPAAPNLNYTASGPTSAGVSFTAVLEWPPMPVSVMPVQLFATLVAARSLLLQRGVLGLEGLTGGADDDRPDIVLEQRVARTGMGCLAPVGVDDRRPSRLAEVGALRRYRRVHVLVSAADLAQLAGGAIVA